MCGVIGGWSRRQFESLVTDMPRMTRALAHRGPDGEGIWSDPDSGVVLGHRRLAIVDLSPGGHQPMHCQSGRWVIAFNGEVYNHAALREELTTAGAAPAWRGHSDTETLLAAVAHWGVVETLRRSVGMFAIVLWDRRDRELWLARDRMGEKPLYFGWNRGAFLFGSELKAFRAWSGFVAELDREALSLFFQYSAVPAPYSIHSGIQKLTPGHCLRLSVQHLERENLPASEPYWSLLQCVENGRVQPFSGSRAEAADALEALLMEAIGGQMVADVPIGALLSGGVDSSAVVALMQTQSREPVRTFSIGFHESGYDEARHAAVVARHLGTNHTELYVSPKDALALIPEVPRIYDEPFADSSQIPTALVCNLTRQRVTVALSGDGGDELLGGYRRYEIAALYSSKLRLMPRWLRDAVSSAIFSIAPEAWDRRVGWLASSLLRRPKGWPAGETLHKAAAVIGSKDFEELYKLLISNGSASLGGDAGAVHPKFGVLPRLSGRGLAERMMYADSMHYLPDDILAKVDRAAMAASLELRAPLLDHRVVEFSWSLPHAYKVVGSRGKCVLRDVLYRHVPRELVDRPKMGFGIPLAEWLRGPLRDWARALIEPARLKREGILDAALVDRLWREHQTGAKNRHSQLWNVLMFQAWHELMRSGGAFPGVRV